MLATERLIEIEHAFGEHVQRIIPLELDGEALRLIMVLKDGANVRVAEQWNGGTLERYCYYWLAAGNDLKIGWDNAPHHSRLSTHPHHKHVGTKSRIEPSLETSLEQVMEVVFNAE